MRDFVPEAPDRRLPLSEVLDRVLSKGVVVVGEATLSVAGIDLVYVGLQLVVTAVDSARASLGAGEVRHGRTVRSELAE